ncbi:malate:quinone oxidoreductase [Mycobacterium tilburgii]
MSGSIVRTDVVLVGAGIMSAALAALLRVLEPQWSITLVAVAAESSSPWHNADTGHAELCEMNYIPERPGSQGSIDITKAVLNQRAIPSDSPVLGLRGGKRHPHRPRVPPRRTARLVSCGAPNESTTCGGAGRRWPPTRCLPPPS